MSQATLDQVRAVLVEQFGVDEIEVVLEAVIETDLGADSIDNVNLIYALEEAFDIVIPDEEFDQAKTVASLVELIDRRVAVAEQARRAPWWKRAI
jgi:acyl carrier protein